MIILLRLVAWLLAAAVTFAWRRIQRYDMQQGVNVSLRERVDAVETERNLTRWAARLGLIGGACMAAAVVMSVV